LKTHLIKVPVLRGSINNHFFPLAESASSLLVPGDWQRSEENLLTAYSTSTALLAADFSKDTLPLYLQLAEHSSR
jgi:hypothetical protein